MHTQKIGLHSQASRKEGSNRNRTTLTLSDQTKALLEKIGYGSMSDGVYISSQIVAKLLKRKILTVDFDDGGIVYRLEGDKEIISSPRSGRDEAKKSHRAKVDEILTPKPKLNPYAGKVLNKEQLMRTGHFTHKMMRAILPGHRVTDRFGYWWERVDNPDSPESLQRGLRSDRGRLMATYVGLENEGDSCMRYL